MQDGETEFDKFWQASSLDVFNVADFARQLSSYDSDGKELSLAFPDAATPLPKVRTKLNTVAQARKSDRIFTGKQLSLKDLSKILSSFRAWNGLEHRAYPSAGATYTIEIFAVCFNVENHQGDVLYYDAAAHGAITLPQKAPSWAQAQKTLNMEITGEPNLLILFVSFPERATAKYGERGGRFALLEAGAALQQLALQLTEAKSLKGVGVGGVLDSVWLNILGLQDTTAQLTIGYLVGQ